jgi:hypothetical protein
VREAVATALERERVCVCMPVHAYVHACMHACMHAIYINQSISAVILCSSPLSPPPPLSRSLPPHTQTPTFRRSLCPDIRSLLTHLGLFRHDIRSLLANYTQTQHQGFTALVVLKY